MAEETPPSTGNPQPPNIGHEAEQERVPDLTSLLGREHLTTEAVSGPELKVKTSQYLIASGPSTNRLQKTLTPPQYTAVWPGPRTVWNC